MSQGSASASCHPVVKGCGCVGGCGRGCRWRREDGDAARCDGLCTDAATAGCGCSDAEAVGV
eukprot:880087-Amphidinium_carterae.2